MSECVSRYHGDGLWRRECKRWRRQRDEGGCVVVAVVVSLTKCGGPAAVSDVRRGGESSILSVWRPHGCLRDCVFKTLRGRLLNENPWPAARIRDAVQKSATKLRAVRYRVPRGHGRVVRGMLANDDGKCIENAVSASERARAPAAVTPFWFKKRIRSRRKTNTSCIAM